jgi:hypothetical protein
MISVCWHFLSVNVPLLAVLSQHTIKTTTCSSINHYQFHSEFVSAETHEIWLLHYLKITKKIQTKGEHFLLLRLCIIKYAAIIKWDARTDVLDYWDVLFRSSECLQFGCSEGDYLPSISEVKNVHPLFEFFL